MLVLTPKSLRSAARLVVAAAVVLSAAAAPSSAAAKRKTAHIVVDAGSGEVLASSRSRRVLHPASLTKMMTLYLTFDALRDGRLKINQTLVASKHAAAQPPSEIGLRAGDKLTVRAAIQATAIKSANDAAVVLAEAVGGTEWAFGRMMTRKARALGMRNTTFRNASGLTGKGHLSTAEDMAILARRLWLDHRDRFELFSERSFRHGRRRFRTTNTLLGVVKGVDGVKTGYTRRAGHNLAASSERKGRRIFVVVMNERSRPRRDRKVTRLLSRGFKLAVKKTNQPRRRLPGPTIAPRRDERLSPAEALAAARPMPTRRPARLRMALASTAAPAIASSRAKSEKPARRAASWAVQVGAFGSARAAEAQLRAVARLDRRAFAAAQTKVVEVARAGGALHRARFVGLNEKSARRSCARLKKAGKDCALVPPTGWRGS